MPSQPPKTTRAPLLLLLPTAAIAAFGLGLLALAATTPVPDVAELPPPGTNAPRADTVAAAVSDEAAAQPAVWPALFGAPAPEPTPPPPMPEPEYFEPEPDEYDTSHYALRGLVYEEGGGWALLETDVGMILVRRGDILPEGEQVTMIAEDGIEISAYDTLYFIGFDGEDFESGGSAPDREDTRAPGYEQGYAPGEPRPPSARDDPPHRPTPATGEAPRNRFGIGAVGR